MIIHAPGTFAAVSGPSWPQVKPWTFGEKFGQLRPLFEPTPLKRGRQTEQWRRHVEAVLWVARTASAWRQVPADFGPWETVVYHYRRWRKTGLWERILQMLLPPSASHMPPLALPAP